METLRIEEIVAKEASDEQLGEINHFGQVIESEIRPDDPPMPSAEFIALTRAEPDYAQLRFWMARDGSRIIAISSIEHEREEANPHVAGLEVAVLPEYRRRGIGRRMLEPVVAAASAGGKTLISSFVSELTAAPGFAEALGARKSMRVVENRLTTVDLDRHLLDEWIERGQDRASYYSLVFWDGVTPDELVGQFARVLNAMNDAPRPTGWNEFQFSPERVSERELRQAKWGLKFWTLCARHDPTGEIAGFTRIYLNPWRPELITQDDTGVLANHRNKGLGRWMKADMLVRILREVTEAKFVTTGNASINQAMLTINRELGFKPNLYWQNYQIETDALLVKLSG